MIRYLSNPLGEPAHSAGMYSGVYFSLKKQGPLLCRTLAKGGFFIVPSFNFAMICHY